VAASYLGGLPGAWRHGPGGPAALAARHDRAARERAGVLGVVASALVFVLPALWLADIGVGDTAQGPGTMGATGSTLILDAYSAARVAVLVTVVVAVALFGALAITLGGRAARAGRSGAVAAAAGPLAVTALAVGEPAMVRALGGSATTFPAGAGSGVARGAGALVASLASPPGSADVLTDAAIALAFLGGWVLVVRTFGTALRRFGPPDRPPRWVRALAVVAGASMAVAGIVVVVPTVVLWVSELPAVGITGPAEEFARALFVVLLTAGVTTGLRHLHRMAARPAAVPLPA
jgi:hypothetical protein